MKPKLSVIIPAYNEETEIAKCLDSLSKQTLDRKFFEVIVINNASTDKTVQIAKKYPFKIVSESKKSVIAARQKGANQAQGEIIVSADADTTYSPNWLAQIKANFDRNSKLIAVVGWIYYRKTPTIFNLLNALNQEINLFLLKFTGKFPIVYAANLAFKRTALEKIGGYPQHLEELGDQQYLLYKFFELGKVIIDPRIYCFTSARRLQNLTKDILLYNGWYRIIGYTLNRLLGRKIIGPAPAIRTIPSRKSRFWR